MFNTIISVLKLYLIIRSTSNVPRNELQEPINILQEEEVLENIANEIEEDTSEMFNQPKLPATKKRGMSKTKKIEDAFTKRAEERNLLIMKIQEQNEHLLKREDNFDEIDMFFKTLAMTVKKLPSAGKIEAKAKMFALMTDLEQKYSVPEQAPYPLSIQPLNNFENLPQYCNVQNSNSDQPSPSTAASLYSGSSCSQFSTFEYDD